MERQQETRDGRRACDTLTKVVKGACRPWHTATLPHLQLPLVVGQGRERVAVVNANDTRGDGLHVGGVG